MVKCLLDTSLISTTLKYASVKMKEKREKYIIIYTEGKAEQVRDKHFACQENKNQKINK